VSIPPVVYRTYIDTAGVNTNMQKKQKSYKQLSSLCLSFIEKHIQKNITTQTYLWISSQKVPQVLHQDPLSVSLSEEEENIPVFPKSLNSIDFKFNSYFCLFV
jgi:hypothetical protein